MSDPLSSEEIEALAILAEECGEVIQAVAKILRHGPDQRYPDSRSSSNSEWLSVEVGDVFAAVDIAAKQGVLNRDIIENARRNKLRHITQWLHHIIDLPYAPTFRNDWEFSCAGCEVNFNGEVTGVDNGIQTRECPNCHRPALATVDSYAKQLALEHARVQRLEEATRCLSENVPRLQDADRMAAAIDVMVKRGAMDARSLAADARLDYGEPFDEDAAWKLLDVGL